MDALHFEGTDLIIDQEALDNALTLDLLECGAPGQPADAAVEYVMDTWEVTGNPEDCRNYLKQYGAWSDEELTDYDTNLERLVWLTGCSLHAGEIASFSTY